MLLTPGSTLFNGKYRIEALVGQGASTEIYRALHLGLRLPRALKVLRKDTLGVGSSDYADYRQRFQLEAQLGAKIVNPHVVQVHDFDEENGLLVLAMEYAAGGSLADRLKRLRERSGRMPVEEAVGIALDAAAGLAAIHDQDAVHRDLKPSNILFDANGRAKVADLGLAQVPGGPSMRSRLSTAAPHPGTLEYMSPEQESSSTFLRPNSDVYALGLILFEMLTGRTYKVILPGTRAGSLRPGVPSALDDLLMHMLADDPKARPFNGTEMAKLLHELDVAPLWNKDEAWQQKPFSEAKPTLPSLVQVKRRSWMLPAVGLSVLMLVAAGVFALLPGLMQPPLLPVSTNEVAPAATNTSNAAIAPTTLGALVPTDTMQPPATSTTVANTPTPTYPPTPFPMGMDRFEYNGDFESASLIAPGVKVDQLNFVPFQPPKPDTVDNDFFRLPVKEGVSYTCETLDLAGGTDTNMIVYDKDQQAVGSSDDISRADRELGKFNSRVSWTASYTGNAYILVGDVNPPLAHEAQGRTYAILCQVGVPPTLTSTEEALATRTSGPGSPQSKATPTVFVQITLLPTLISTP